MADRPTDVPGAALRRIRGQDYVVVYVDRMFPGPPPTIRGLADQLHLQPEVVLNALLGYRSNAPVVRSLYREVIERPFPDFLQARRQLRQRAQNISIEGHRSSYRMGPAYLGWGVSPQDGQPVVLPLSQGFGEVMRDATASRRREARIRSLTPAFQALETELREIRLQAGSLSDNIDLLDALTRNHAREIALLEALDGLLGLLLRFPKDPVDADDRRDVEQLRQQLLNLKTQAHRHMILDPPDSFRANLIGDRNRLAAELRQKVEDSTFVNHIRTLVNNRDIAPAQLWADAHDALRLAFMALLLSPEAEPVLVNHVMPLIEVLASRSFDLSGLSAPNHTSFDQAVRQVPTPPPISAIGSALVILAGLAGLTPQVVGNVPGPSSLAVGVLNLAAPQLLARVVNNRMQATTLGARLYRALVNAADLSLAQRVALIEAIDQGNLSQLRRIDWSSRFMNSPTWGAAMGLASAICFVAAIQADDTNTLRSWANILGSGSGTAASIAVIVGRYSTLVRDSIVRGIGGRILGVVGGIAAVVSGATTAIEEYQTRDQVGMWTSIAAATGGALSVAGFLLAAGAGTASTGIGAPPGALMMAAGVIIGIGAGVVSIIRSITTAGSHVIFEAFINHFGRAGGPYHTAASARPALRQAFETLQSGHHSVDFWDADPAKIPQLFDLGFNAQHIAQVVNEDESLVQRRLQSADRI
ncbi:MAG: hypothetical protein PVH61_25770 [Candidatus Aminicenantes bacterium]